VVARAAFVDDVAVADDPAQKSALSRLRAALAGIAGVIAIVGLIASVVAVWGHGVLFDEDRVASAVDSALEQPEVTAALATYVTDQVIAAADLDQVVEGILPTNLARLTPALVGGARSLVIDQLDTLLATPRVRGIVTGLVRQGHRSAMRLLEGDGVLDGVSVQAGEVTVNLLPLVGLGLQSVQSIGLLSGVTIPELTVDGDPAAQQAALEAALGRTLADDFGQLVVYRSDALANAGNTLSNVQRTMAVVKRAMVAVLLATVVAFAAALLLARRRRRALVTLVLASVAAFVLTRAVIVRVVQKAPTLAIDPAARAAIAASVQRLADGLLTAITLLVIVGLLVALAAYLTGSSTTAVGTRQRVAGSSGSLVAAAVAHRDAVALIALAAAVVLIAVAGFGTVQLVVAGLFLLVAAWARWAPRRTVRTSRSG
jgi:hypothetical protein